MMTTALLATDQEALYRAVLSHPADDTPRRVYADWLEDNGEPKRAEFIRVQCELARLTGGDRCYPCGWPIAKDGNGCRAGGDCSYRPSKRSSDHDRWLGRMHEIGELRRRERELWETSDVVGGWLIPDAIKGVPSYIEQNAAANSTAIHKIVWGRGFAYSITCSWVDWLRVHEKIFWQPEQSVECPMCGHISEKQVNDIQCLFGRRPLCVTCGGRDENGHALPGTGRVPRPFTYEERCPNKCEHLFPYSRKKSINRWYRCESGVVTKCRMCSGRGTVTRSLVGVAQPLEVLRLSTWPGPRGWEPHRYQSIDAFTVPNEVGETPSGMKFTREKCQKCDGVGLWTDDGERARECDVCFGQPLNLWTCDAWPGLRIEMPESPP